MKPTPDFSDTERAFAHMTGRELKRAVFLFSFITKTFWVNTGKLFLSIAQFFHIPYGWVVRKNIFAHFCGGETIEKCLPVMQKLACFHCFSILDYSAEGLSGESNLDSVCEEILDTVKMADKHQTIAFGVFKFTGMAEFSLLEAISTGTGLYGHSLNKWEKASGRAQKIFETASQIQLPVFVDAEETWIQPAIDSMVENMMQKFNKNKAIVHTTVQMYRVDGLLKVTQLIEHARTNSYYTGIKLVRGAYMEKERERAAKLGYPSPIHPTKEDTDNAFRDAVELCLSNIQHVSVCIATHNEESCMFATRMMNHLQIPENDPRVWFAQLYGMSDHITFNLAHSSFNVAKYLPFGPVEKVMPYLVRRAEENSSVADQSNREILNFRTELKRRKKV
jgi:proline dehydrogenase